MHRYLLIDCAVRPDAARTLRFYAEGLSYRSLFLNQPEEKHSDVGPWLVQIDASHTMHGWLNALEGTGDCIPCVSHLATELGFEATFQHLQSMIEMQLSDGSSALLRFYDPRVMKRLLGILTAEQLEMLLAPFVEWKTTVGRYSNAKN